MDSTHSSVSLSQPAHIIATTRHAALTETQEPPDTSNNSSAVPKSDMSTILKPFESERERLEFERAIDENIAELNHTVESQTTPANITETMTIDEFEAVMEATKAQREREGMSASGARKRDILGHKPANTNASTGGRTTVNHAATPPSAARGYGVTPVALGKPYTSENVQKLYQVATQHQLMQPEFHFTEHGASGAGSFSAKLVLGFRGLEEGKQFFKEVVDERPYKSKKEAKDGIAETGLKVIEETLQALEQGGDATTTTATAGVENQRPSSMMNSSSSQPTTENVIGLLLEFATAFSLPQPSYQMFSTSLQSFACEVTVTLPPTAHDSSKVKNSLSAPTGDPSKTVSQTFGSSSRPFAQKRQAKTAAAAAAIHYLRSIGLLDSSGTGPILKKPKKAAAPAIPSPAASIAPGTTATSAAGLPQALPASVVPAAVVVAATVGAQSALPPTQQVAALCSQLGLTNITYKLTASPGTALYSGAGYFEQEGSSGFGEKLQGPLGSVEGIFGRQNAKEEIAGAVVGILTSEVERRRRGTVGVGAGAFVKKHDDGAGDVLGCEDLD